MEIWLIYALSSLFFAGIQNFIFKIAAVRNYNVSIINKYTYFVSAIFGFIFFLFYFKDYSVFNLKLTVFFAFLHSLFYSLSIFSRVKSMQNIDSVIFFPLYKTFGPIMVTIISLLFFQESLTFHEILGVIIGIIVPLLLINNAENKIQKNLFLGVFFILVTAILTSISSSFNKEIMTGIYNFPLYIFASGVFGTIFSYLTHYGNKKNNHKYNNNGVIKFSIISGIFGFLGFYCVTKAMEGNLAIVFTINSFSILIPIILSIIFYKEHLNFRKILVIILSIISIILFI